MIWFKDEQNEKLKKLLKHSRQDFRFDRTSVKNRLLTSLDTATINAYHKPIFAFHIVRFSVATFGLIIFISASFAFASTSQPGEKLFALNKLGEKIILSLPLSTQQNADIQSKIVERRFEALDQVTIESRVLETVKESDETLNQAVLTILTNKAVLQEKGNETAVKKLDEVLTHLDTIAADQEQKIQKLKDNTKDEKTKAEIQEHLVQFRQARHNARVEIKLEKEQPKNQ